MRFVVYDVESLEAITVINLPITERDIATRNNHWRVPVPEDFNFNSLSLSDESNYHVIRTVDLWFERFERHSPQYGRQWSWMCLTKSADLAMLLDPDFLPGQAPTVRNLIDCCDKLTAHMLRMLG